MQLRDFSGLRWGAITPTDLDGFLDFGDKLFVFAEFKLSGQMLPAGQRLAFERLVDACESETRKSIGFVAEHDNREGDICAAQCRVVEYRWHQRWVTPRESISLKDAIDRLRTNGGDKR